MSGEILPGQMLDILAFGGRNNAPTSSILVNGTGVAYSNSFPLPKGYSFGWAIQLSGAGAQAVKVELEQGNARPATEGAADTAGWVVPDSKVANPIFSDIVDTLLHHNPYSPVPTAFGRLKFTGLAGNDVSTTVVVAQRYIIRNF